jgi:hypothetical protein
MDCFHLAYVPAATNDIALDDNVSSRKKPCSDGDGEIRCRPIVAIRRASCLRLYRHHRRYESGKDHVYTAEADPFLPRHSSASSPAELSADKENFGEANVLLAVLVPNSLTRSLINLIDSHNNIQENDSENREVLNQQIIDAELELRQSIHPCLWGNGLRNTSLNDIKSNKEHGKETATIEESTSSSPLFVCEIITSDDVTNFPTDVVILSFENRNNNENKQDDRCQIISHYINLINHDTASGAPWFVLKAFPLCNLSVLPVNSDTADMNSKVNAAALPCCPVCLNLIEPTHVGLPQLKPQYKCSRWCSESNNFNDNNIHHFISPLPECVACQVIVRRGVVTSMELKSSTINRLETVDSNLHLSWRAETNDQDQHNQIIRESPPSRSSNSCYKCGMSTTLWVCLTCGVVGCGRYTRKHAEDHYTSERHPYSFELATGRIWDYDNSTFVHRKDLIECPVMSLNWGNAFQDGPSSTLIARSTLGDDNQQLGSLFSESESSNVGWRKDNVFGYRHRSSGLDGSIASGSSTLNPTTTLESKLTVPTKKSLMISEEFEALLHSALDDQSQHYEGEISRLRATLASSRMQGVQISDRESREIHALQKNIESLLLESEKLSAVLLEAQTNELKLKSTSQRLLREQSVSKALLEKIHQETMTEHESGKLRLEDLEMQVADLTANLRMMAQLKEEEIGGTICGTVGGENDGKQQKKKKGKKKGGR